ncbi:hypothetical protein ELAN111203_14130 [Elizabethkingia anophelis]
MLYIKIGSYSSRINNAKLVNNLYKKQPHIVAVFCIKMFKLSSSSGIETVVFIP